MAGITRPITVIAAILLFCATTRAATPLYYHPIPTLAGQTGALGTAVSDSGVAVGIAIFPGSSSTDRAFRWTSSGGIEALTDTAGTTYMNRAWGLTHDASLIVGYQFASGPNPTRAATWTSANKLQLLVSSNPTFHGANDVSADGSVLAGEGALPQVSVRWSGGTAQALPNLPGDSFAIARGISDDGNFIVGSSQNANAYRWSSGTGIQYLGVPPGKTKSHANAVNSNGSVIVGRGGDFGSSSAFRWQSGVGMLDLGDLPGGGAAGIANDVSADGSIVVGSSTTALGEEAFIWDATNGMRRLHDLLQIPVHPYWVMRSALGISPDGSIITGEAFNALTGETEAFVVSPEPNNLPEPTALMLAPLLGGWLLRRGRRA